jgi:hypothetical protein
MITLIGLAALTLHCLPHLPTTPKAAPPAAVSHTDEQTITAHAAAVYVARAAYRAALETPDPARALDGISDALPEVMPQVLDIVKVAPPTAEALHTATAERLRAYTVVERARTTWNPDYTYVLDALADGLGRGGDPDSVRADVRRLAGQFSDMQAGQ